MGLIGSEPGASRQLRRMGKAQGWRAGDAQMGLLHICVQDYRLCVEYGVTQACLACDTAYHFPLPPSGGSLRLVFCSLSIMFSLLLLAGWDRKYPSHRPHSPQQ